MFFIIHVSAEYGIMAWYNAVHRQIDGWTQLMHRFVCLARCFALQGCLTPVDSPNRCECQRIARGFACPSKEPCWVKDSFHIHSSNLSTCLTESHHPPAASSGTPLPSPSSELASGPQPQPAACASPSAWTQPRSRSGAWGRTRPVRKVVWGWSPSPGSGASEVFHIPCIHAAGHTPASNYCAVVSVP